jgi:hypothetical protein
MAGHVVDSLFVELGLDASKFDKEQQEALSRFKRTQDLARKGARDVEDSGKSVIEALEGIKTQALEMFAVIAGGKGLIEFSTQLTHADAALGRVERSTGVAASTISKWQAVVRIFGGDAKTMAQSFVSISDAFAGWKVGAVSPLIADLRAISTAGGKIIDVNKGVEQSYLDLAENLKNIHDQDPALAGFLGRKIGLDPGLFDAMIQGNIRKVLELVRELHTATEQDISAFGELEKRIGLMGVRAEGIGRTMLGGDHGLAARIIALADELFKPIDKNWLWDTGLHDALFQTGRYGQKGYGKLLDGTAAPSPRRAFASNEERVSFIRAEAVRQGQSPDVWEKLYGGEGKAGYSGDYDATGKPTSFGAFQLHYPGVGRNTADGLGTLFTKETGLDARDPNTEPEQIAWSMRYARTRGLSAWHGWHGDQWANIRGAGAGGGDGAADNSTNISVNGPITINAGAGADGAKIAGDFRRELIQRQSRVWQSDYGQN